MAWVNPITWTSIPLTSVNLNTLRDALKAIGDPMTAYTPTWTADTVNPTIGNGTRTGSYSEAGKRIDLVAEVLFGSTTTAGTGAYQLSLPVEALGSNKPIGTAMVRTAGGGRKLGVVYTHTTTIARVVLADDTLLGSSTRAWANGDRFTISVSYEGA